MAEYERQRGILGPERLDYTAAQIVATLINANRGEHDAAVGLDDVMMRWGQAEEYAGDIHDFARALAGKTDEPATEEPDEDDDDG